MNVLANLADFVHIGPIVMASGLPVAMASDLPVVMAAKLFLKGAES